MLSLGAEPLVAVGPHGAPNRVTGRSGDCLPREGDFVGSRLLGDHGGEIAASAVAADGESLRVEAQHGGLGSDRLDGGDGNDRDREKDPRDTGDLFARRYQMVEELGMFINSIFQEAVNIT